MQSNLNTAYVNSSSQYIRTSNPTQVQNSDDVKKMQEAYANIDVKELTNGYLAYFQNQISSSSNSNFISQFSAFSSAQGSGLSEIFGSSGEKNSLENILSDIDFKAIGYEGKPITELTQKEAEDITGENGFFGINNTADRISNFIINAAGDDLNKLQAGKEGMLKGFSDAAKIWGGELPEISQKTIERATESVDKRIAELGGNVLNVKA